LSSSVISLFYCTVDTAEACAYRWSPIIDHIKINRDHGHLAALILN